MLGFLPTRAYRPGTPGATTFLSPLSGTFNYGWDSFEGYSYRDIAKTLRLKETSVGKLIARAKKALRESLEEGW